MVIMEATCPSSTSSYLSNAAAASSSSSTKRQSARILNNIKVKRSSISTTTTLSSSTTNKLSPLFFHTPPQSQNKIELLDSTIREIENCVENGIIITSDIFSSLVEACSKMGTLEQGMRVHSRIPPTLIRRDPSLRAKLIRFYAVHGRLDDAHQLFDEIPHINSVFAWNSLISGYVSHRRNEEALALYYQMREMDIEPDVFTFPRVLKACSGIGSLCRGEDVHRHVIRLGFGEDLFITNSLVDMYAKCGVIVKARRLFDSMHERDHVSWNTMMLGYVRHGCFGYAIDVCRKMVLAGFEMDSVGMSALITACTCSMDDHGWLRVGLQMHARALRRRLDMDSSVSNALIEMYSQTRSLKCAQAVFDCVEQKDVVSWNTIIKAYSRVDTQRAFLLFETMVNTGVIPDSVTFVALLHGCGSQRASSASLVANGRYIFHLMQEEYGIEPCLEHYACMVNLLGRAGYIEEAYEMIIKRLQRPPMVAGASIWGALLFNCTVHGEVEVGEVAAEKLFDLEPDNVENFHLLLQLYCGAKRWNDVEKVRKMIRERGL